MDESECCSPNNLTAVELIRRFQKLGCKDELKCAVASAVYVNLLEVVQINNLQYLYDEGLDLMYFRGQRDDNYPEIVVPVPSTQKIDMLQFEEIQRRLGCDLKCVTMAICDPSSTILYYSVGNGFIEK